MDKPDKCYKPDQILHRVNPGQYYFTVLRWCSMWDAYDKSIKWTPVYMQQYETGGVV